MRIKGLKRCSVLALCIMQLSTVSISALTAEADNFYAKISNQSLTAEYSEYLNAMSQVPNAKESLFLSLDGFSATEEASIKFEQEYNGQCNVLVWQDGNGSITTEFDVPQTALYALKLTYLPTETGIDPEIGILLDGSAPFEGSDKIVLPREWKNATEEAREDDKGNELTPEQVETGSFIIHSICDSTGVNIDPYLICLTAGKHQFTINSPEQTLAIAAVEFSVPDESSKYQNPQIGNQNLKIDPIYIEGEDAVYKSSNTFVPLSDTGNAGMSPASPYLTKLNYIGGTSWNSPGDKLTWDFYAPKSGYYKLCFRYKQADLVNGESWRWLKIDGATPFEECKSMRFSYDPKWSFYSFSNSSGKPYYIYLEKGEHEISLEVTLGVMSQYYSRLSEVVSGLGDEYISIVKITGDTPDANRDYELFNQIPDLNKKLSDYSSKLSGIAKDMQSFTGKKGSQYIAAMKNMIRVLDAMVEKPYSAHQYVKDFYTNYSTLSSWLYEMKNMPLSIDWIQFCPAEDEFEIEETDFITNLVFGVKRFLFSFVVDYQSSASKNGEKEIRLWVNWGRDQTMVLNTLIRDSFTAETGISVNLQQVNASLINGILAGNFPDLTLHMARTDPVNLGIRGALLNLYDFPDCEKVLTRFQEGAELPYSYDGELYALPDTQNFFVMFYRSDILESMGLSVPKTWDEFLETAIVIQQNNMQVYIPYTQITTATTVNGGIGGLNLFPTLMLQHGLSIYNDDLTATALSEPEALQTFEEWTDLYLDYQFVKEADFYNRFRVGTMPLGIAPYSTYLMLYDAAPEIKGRWSVSNVPATDGGNGYIAGSGTGCGIVKKSKNQKEAWEFLKWWTSAETQTRYSNNVESILGMLGRPQTANVEAFKNLVWDSQHKENLLEQWALVREIPEIPGSYYMTRSIDQAYWQVINGRANVKDAVVKWSSVADKEIQRKLKEYSK